MNPRFFLALLTSALFCYFYPSPSFAATEPAVNTMPSIDPPGATNYFDLKVNYTVPAGATGVLVVVRQTYSPVAPPADNTAYTANARIGAGDTTRVCAIYCEWVVADATVDGFVTVSGLKAGTKHYFAVYAYNKLSPTDINYNQTISPAINVASATTTITPLAGKSHNELYVAASGTMTSADCVTACHAQHHTAQMLPRGQAQMDACVTCHNGTSATDNIGLHPADGSVDCGSCHSLHSFKTEELYSTDPAGNKAFNLSFIRKNMSKYINPTMYPPPSGGGTTTALDNTVFQDRTTDYAFKDDPAVTSYNAVCQTCHTTAAHHTQTSSDNHHVNPTTGVDDLCTSCHNHKGGFAAGGHTVDFGKTASCTTTGCHTGTKVLEDIHGDGTSATCTLCHNDPPSRDSEKLGARGLGDATNANNTAASGTWTSVTCVTCHDVTTPDPDLAVATLGGMHHGHANATGGVCISCHMPKVGSQGNPIATRNTIMMPTNLACNWCHLWWPNNTSYITQTTDNGYNTALASGKVMIYRLTFDPVTNQRQMATIAPLTSHAISTNAATPISDYGACFACHGATGVDNGRADALGQADMVRPFHGLGNPVTSTVAVNLTGSNADFTRHVNNFFAGPQQNVGFTKTADALATTKTLPYNPGYAAFNVLALDVGSNQAGGQKPYATDNTSFKYIHLSEKDIRGIVCRNTAIGSTTSPIQYNNWGPDLGAVGTITVNFGGVEGSTNKQTNVPLVNLSLPTSIGPQAGCP